MSNSLRRRLVFSLCGGMVAAWLATAYFTYVDTRGLVDEVIDEHLSQTADMLLMLGNRLPSESLGKTQPTVARNDVQQPLSYRVRLDPHSLNVIVSAGTELPATDWIAGYRDLQAAGESWRIYGAASGTGLYVDVAARHEIRESFASRIAAHILHPLWIATPLLSVLIWGLVRWGLRPLDRVADNVRRRSATDFSPLATDAVPTEIMPLVQALDALLGRIKTARARDRRFAADAAHELRTPLAAIRAHAQVAQQASDTSQQRAAIADVLVGAERGTRIVEQLLALARVENVDGAEDREKVDIARLAREALIDIAPRAAALNIDIGLEGGEDVLPVAGNADLLAAMLRNLVDNALRYGGGGSIDVVLSQRDGQARLRVEDRGPGIPPELRSRVLDRFFRAPGSRGDGSGLGLSIVAAIVEAHGGNFVLTDRPSGPGVRAEVTLPLCPDCPLDGLRL